MPWPRPGEWGFAKIRGTILGVPNYSILGSILGSPILGNYYMRQRDVFFDPVLNKLT